MKKLLPLLLFVPILCNAQFLPDDIAPTGWIHPMTELEIDLEAHVSADGLNTFQSDGNAIQCNYDATTIDEGIKFGPYDIGGTGEQNFIDITGNPVVYLKMKGTIGKKVRVNLKNTATYAFVNGWEMQQTISCSGFSWYKFDFTGATDENEDPLSEISEIEVGYQSSFEEAGTITIDSMLVGTTNITPNLPTPLDEISWEAGMTTDWKYLNGDDDNGVLSASNGVITATFTETSSVDAVLGFTVNNGASATSIDITSSPTVAISIKGQDGDTVRINFKSPAPDYEFIDGYQQHFILNGGNDFKEYVIDYTAVDGIEAIGLVEIDMQPTTQFVGTIEINSLKLGAVDAEACSDNQAVGIREHEEIMDLNYYPNPAANELHLSLEAKGDVAIELVNMLGVAQYTSHSEAHGQFEQTIPVQNLEAGMYMLSVQSGGRQSSRLVRID